MCYTKGVSAFLPAFLQGRTLLGLLSAPSALVEVVVDSDRHVLYTRSASSVVQARPPGGLDIWRSVTPEGMKVYTDGHLQQSGCFRKARTFRST